MNWTPPDIDQSEDVNEAVDEDVAVAEWRAGQLERLGVSRLLAGILAPEVDWHEVERLVKRGCPPDLALAIVY
jgi:hypothetical protein